MYSSDNFHLNFFIKPRAVAFQRKEM